MEEEAVELGECRVAWETNEALKVVFVSFSEDIESYPEETTWIPKSQIHDDSEVSGQDDEGTISVNRWFAKKQGWVE